MSFFCSAAWCVLRLFVSHNTSDGSAACFTTRWSAEWQVLCCAVLRGTVYRCLTCVSDTRWVSLTLTQPVRQSVSQSVTCSVCQFGSSHARKQLPTKWVCVAYCCCCCCCGVCAAVYDCNTFLRMSHAPRCCYLRLFAGLTLLCKKLLNCYISHLW